VQVPELIDAGSCVWASWGGDTTRPAYTTNGATWSAGYEGVWHMRQPNVVDSSPFGRNGAGMGAVSTTPGRIGSGLTFGGVVADFVGITGYPGVLGQADRTVSAWVRTAQDNGAFVSWGANVGGQKWTFRVQVGNGTAGAIRTEVNGGYVVHNQDIRDNNWHHAVITLANDGSPNITEGMLYVDGRLGQSTSLDEPINTANNADVRLGLDFSNRPLNGDLDEIRISSVVRSSNWVWTTWFNSASNGAFNCYTLDPSNSAVMVDHQPASGIRLTSAVLNASFSDLGAVADVWVYWGPTNAGTNPTGWSNVAFIGSFTNQPLTDLSFFAGSLMPSTTYWYAFRATNCLVDVWGQPSATFSTDLNLPAVNNETGAVVSVGSAVLNGVLITGNLADVSFYWGDDDAGTSAAAWDNVVSAGTVPDGPASAMISGLLFGQDYYYRTFASNDVGTAWASSTTNFKSLNPGTVVVSNQPVSALTEVAATLNAVVDASNAVVDVLVYYGTSDGGTNAFSWSNVAYVATVTDAVADLSFNLSGLSSGATIFYTFRVTNCLFSGWAEPSDTFTVPSYTNSLKITFCGYGGGEALTNFPVLVRLGTNVPGFDYSG
ncbi:MAG: LamG domain-containing protein, partial [Verrucomicrobiota bacterium]